MNIQDLTIFTNNNNNRELITQVWNVVSENFRIAQQSLPAQHAMDRKEISFHDHIKVLGYLSLLTEKVTGDIVEIGVWKGKSLSLMAEVSNNICRQNRKIFGIDPLEIKNQDNELEHYRKILFPEAMIIKGHSESKFETINKLSSNIALLHIDGGHTARNVLLDFLLYSSKVSSGGFIVFDDYSDQENSPEVGPAVDLLRAAGQFKDYKTIGCIPEFYNSYIIQKN